MRTGRLPAPRLSGQTDRGPLRLGSGMGSSRTGQGCGGLVPHLAHAAPGGVEASGAVGGESWLRKGLRLPGGCGCNMPELQMSHPGCAGFINSQGAGSRSEPAGARAAGPRGAPRPGRKRALPRGRGTLQQERRARMVRLELLVPVWALALSTGTAGMRHAEEQEAVRYLRQFGYLQKPLEHPTDDFSAAEIAEAMRAFQLASELPGSGRLDAATLERMRRPRCGLEDPFNQKTQKYTLLGRWRKRHLTYRVQGAAAELGEPGVRAAVRAAVRYWAEVAPLSFREVRHGWADIRFSFHGAVSPTCSRPFDGPGRVLAHADLPEDGSVHFDAAERWTEGTPRGTNLRVVAAHELGHALGLGHSRHPAALMAPVYAGYRPRFRLHPDDVRGIQALYGRRTPVPVPTLPASPTPVPVPTLPASPTPVPVPTLPASPTPVPDPCTGRLDALMLGPHDKTYAFRGAFVWTVTDFGTTPPLRVSAVWPGLPGGLDAAVHSPRTGRTYFFKGDKVWRYRGFKLEPGYPKPLTRVPAGIDAALYWPVNQKIFLFKGTGYWQWDELGWNHFASYPKETSALFAGAPVPPDAAVAWTNGKVYFFQGGRYWRLSRQLRAERGYPRGTAERWMRC
ncbi:matrix metalloproteinase-19 [Struthio camelus]|uniref:matrix metalloproteinase-19 n=1 Tax=Struthio camelus TaxID=8801 RepID=UPI003603F579